MGIRKSQFVERRLNPGDDLHQRLGAMNQGTAQLREADITPTRNHKIGQCHQRLVFEFMAHLWAAQNNLHIGPLRFKEGDHLARLLNVPDVDPKANNLNGSGWNRAALGQQRIHNVFWRALDGEFLQHGVLV